MEKQEDISPALKKVVSQSQDQIQHLVKLLGALRFQYLEKEKSLLDEISLERKKLEQYLEIAKNIPPQ